MGVAGRSQSREREAEGQKEANESGSIETGRMAQTEGDCSSTGQIEPLGNAEVVATIQIATLAHNKKSPSFTRMQITQSFGSAK